jgi:pimeloyl-ACP methyl ester carboxylesterase
MGRDGIVMAFVHPNPMDQSCWMYQMAHFSTWYRCIAVDVPGYGRSPGADAGVTLGDIADATWEAIDAEFGDEPAILVGCSVGASVVPLMHERRPSQTLALILTGTGYRPPDDPAAVERREMRIRNYQELGPAYRWRYTFEDFSPAFRSTQLAHYFANLFAERNEYADVPTIVRQFRAERLDARTYEAITCPTLILTGTEDNAHRAAWALKGRIPGCELQVLPGAGHACQLEQPWLFDELMLEFLRSHAL